MTKAASTVAAAALAFAPAAVAGIAGRPHDARVGETQTIDIDFTNDVNARVATVMTRIPETADLVTASPSDPAWIPTRTGRTVEWHGGQLLQGRHLHVRLALRFAVAGPAAVVARLTYVGGASEQELVLVDVRGTASRNDVLIVLLGGGLIFLGAVTVFVVGRRALRN